MYIVHGGVVPKFNGLKTIQNYAVSAFERNCVSAVDCPNALCFSPAVCGRVPLAASPARHGRVTLASRVVTVASQQRPRSDVVFSRDQQVPTADMRRWETGGGWEVGGL